MTEHPLAQLFARLWKPAAAVTEPDAADLGTAWGLDMSLRQAEASQAAHGPDRDPRGAAGPVTHR